MTDADREFWRIIIGNYTPEELAGYVLWAERLEILHAIALSMEDVDD